MRRKDRHRRSAIFLFLVVILAISTYLVLTFPILPSAVLLLLQSESPRLRVPVEGVSSASLIDTFGAPRGGGRHHKGIDIFAQRGHSVLSATNGVVTRVGQNRLGGRTVWVLGPGAKWHYYAHLEKYGDVKRGQRVEAGHRLGTVGDSGNAKGTPPHLHYAVYNIFGIAIDPYPLLVRRGNAGRVSQKSNIQKNPV